MSQEYSKQDLRSTIAVNTDQHGFDVHKLFYYLIFFLLPKNKHCTQSLHGLLNIITDFTILGEKVSACGFACVDEISYGFLCSVSIKNQLTFVYC